MIQHLKCNDTVAANFSDQIRIGTFSGMVVELLQECLHTYATCSLKLQQ